jgi:hypothetical protein
VHRVHLLLTQLTSADYLPVPAPAYYSGGGLDFSKFPGNGIMFGDGTATFDDGSALSARSTGASGEGLTLSILNTPALVFLQVRPASYILVRLSSVRGGSLLLQYREWPQRIPAESACWGWGVRCSCATTLERRWQAATTRHCRSLAPGCPTSRWWPPPTAHSPSPTTYVSNVGWLHSLSTVRRAMADTLWRGLNEQSRNKSREQLVLAITVRGVHIQGSPYTVTVATRCGAGQAFSTGDDGGDRCEVCPAPPPPLQRCHSAVQLPATRRQPHRLSVGARGRCVLSRRRQVADTRHGGWSTQDCPAGMYTANAGSLECLSCPAGSFAPRTGATNCLSCDTIMGAAFYQNSEGADACKRCPLNMERSRGLPGLDIAECDCIENSYRQGASLCLDNSVKLGYPLLTSPCTFNLQ